MGKGRHFLQLMDYELALFYPRLSNVWNSRVEHIRENLKKIFQLRSKHRLRLNACTIPAHSWNCSKTSPFEAPKKQLKRGLCKRANNERADRKKGRQKKGRQDQRADKKKGRQEKGPTGKRADRKKGRQEKGPTLFFNEWKGR